MQIAFTYMTDGFSAPTGHLGKQINYNMKFLVSKGKRQQNQGNRAKPNSIGSGKKGHYERKKKKRSLKSKAFGKKLVVKLSHTYWEAYKL